MSHQARLLDKSSSSSSSDSPSGVTALTAAPTALTGKVATLAVVATTALATPTTVQPDKPMNSAIAIINRKTPPSIVRSNLGCILSLLLSEALVSLQIWTRAMVTLAP